MNKQCRSLYSIHAISVQTADVTKQGSAASVLLSSIRMSWLVVEKIMLVLVIQLIEYKRESASALDGGRGN
ncbi:hypothetical protein FE392_03675 [Xenorhabdus sp. 12]|uniref:Uncharacterized protein n=1 Tax=Xenorhabdus santafensis TaxID=2582833 RepID=A0ABU4S5F4_9GAMM|nr:hypothetical protein [Xenorhabdus sp. 12]MDX7986434.1 hypothetical protein [Xenorhabdus sp. 12]